MRTKFLLIIICITFSFCGNTDAGQQYESNAKSIIEVRNVRIDYTGRWVWKSKDSETQFTLEIKQEGDSINGLYCASAYSGNRLDCPSENEFNIFGRMNRDTVFINFSSFYGAIGGEALLTGTSTKSIKWEIKKWPTGGDCFAPPSVELKKVN